jgi:AhpD family alkylhydroperoxidase
MENEKQESPMVIFQREAPEVAAAFNGLIMSLVASKGLDPKTKQLIYIAMKASTGDEMAVKAHVPMAIQAGATREEVVDAILMTLTVSGIKGIVTCLPGALKHFEKK